ncbi:hypothetical protein VNO78_21223 [Psophocarpus tetragonolobus]|uniref:Uncharacterized protein n=1 Tax=Psophocarpus tetragonolobus TaxID=3891 RepID=A0AAN9SBP8_PSOTE
MKKSQPTSNGRRNNNNKDDNNNRKNINFPSIVFTCPRCPAIFFTSHERDVHYFEEILTISGPQEAIQKLKKMTQIDNNPIKNCPNCRRTQLLSKNFACAMEHRRATRTPVENYKRFNSRNHFKGIATPSINKVDSNFKFNHEVVLAREPDQEATSRAVIPPPPPLPSSKLWAPIRNSPPPPTILPKSQMWSFERKSSRMAPNPLLPVMNQSMTPIPNGNPDPQFHLMGFNGLAAEQEGQASSPGPLAVDPPMSQAEIEATTLRLGLPGSEKEKKETKKKPKLDLNLRI